MITLPEVGTAILLIALVIAAACGRHFYRAELKPQTPQQPWDWTADMAHAEARFLDTEVWLHNGGMNA